MNSVVSIVLPVYNSENYLEQCLQSIVQQSFSGWECLIVDDGSTDASRKICERFVAIDSRFKLFTIERSGVSSARNFALKKAVGPWILFVDSDDMIECNALRNLVRHTSKSIDLLRGQAACVSKDLLTSRLLFNERTFTLLNNPFATKVHTASWAYLFRLSIIKENNLCFRSDLQYSEDCLFVCSYMMKSRSMLLLPDLVYYYRQSEGSACASTNYKKKYFSHIKAAGSLYRFLNGVRSDKIAYSEILRLQGLNFQSALYEFELGEARFIDGCIMIMLYFQESAHFDCDGKYVPLACFCVWWKSVKKKLRKYMFG